MIPKIEVYFHNVIFSTISTELLAILEILGISCRLHLLVQGRRKGELMLALWQ